MSRFVLISLLSLILPFGACAKESQYQEGRHYLRISQPMPVTGGKVEVLEFFSYGCPHCMAFEPYYQEWVKTLPAGVKAKQIPSVMNKGGEVQAKIFYAAEDLGVLEKVHKALFNSVQVERKPVFTDEQIVAMVKGLGIDEKVFLDAMRSFDIDSRVRKAMQTMREYKISGVPSVVVNGQYLTGGGMVGNFAELIKVLDYLVARETGVVATKSVAKNKSKAANID